jgi:integrase
MTVARIFKRCPCPEGEWDSCLHQWVVRYRTTGGRSSRQREQSFGTDRREAEDFALKVEHDKLSASRIGCAHLVVSAVLAEAVRDRKLPESPCSGIQLPGVVTAADFILPAHAQIEAVAAGLPPDWAATVWLMHGCGLRIGEALAVNLRCRINRGKTLRVKEQVNPAAQLKPLKFRPAGEFRDIPLPRYVSEAIDKHVAGHGITPDGYLFQGRKYKLVVRRSYQEDFQRAATRAGLPPEFIPHSLRHLYASTALAEGIPITEVSRWLGHRSIEVTHQIYGHLVPSSFDRARTALDAAYSESRRQPTPKRQPDPAHSHREAVAEGVAVER